MDKGFKVSQIGQSTNRLFLSGSIGREEMIFFFFVKVKIQMGKKTFKPHKTIAKRCCYTLF
jgi:hypothetical protein